MAHGEVINLSVVSYKSGETHSSVDVKLFFDAGVCKLLFRIPTRSLFQPRSVPLSKQNKKQLGFIHSFIHLPTRTTIYRAASFQRIFRDRIKNGRVRSGYGTTQWHRSNWHPENEKMLQMLRTESQPNCTRAGACKWNRNYFVRGVLDQLLYSTYPNLNTSFKSLVPGVEASLPPIFSFRLPCSILLPKRSGASMMMAKHSIAMWRFMASGHLLWLRILL